MDRLELDIRVKALRRDEVLALVDGLDGPRPTHRCPAAAAAIDRREQIRELAAKLFDKPDPFTF